MSTLFDTREIGITSDIHVTADDAAATLKPDERPAWTPPTAEEMDLLGW
jgi:hypothetical protein